MNSRTSRTVKIAGLIFAVLFMWNDLSAQCTVPVERARVIAADAGTGRDTVWFGNHPTGNPGIDAPLCEFELPPVPPAGVFDFRLVNPPGRDGIEPPAGLGQGVDQDYRHYFSNTQIDTFKIKFQPGDGGFPMTISWSSAQVLLVCDSARLRDEFGGFFVNVNMGTSSSVQVAAAPPITTLLITKYGARLTGVAPVSNQLPTRFALEQNYPNPFNPSTTMRFAVQQASHTDISVYDVLGRKVATLVSQELTPGFYNATWNGTDQSGRIAASGIYFVRMTADAGNAKTFTAMQKIMLLK